MHMHPLMPYFVGVMSAILLVGILLRRLQQPHVVAYLAAGVLLGPSGFGFVEDTAMVARLGRDLRCLRVGPSRRVLLGACRSGQAEQLDHRSGTPDGGYNHRGQRARQSLLDSVGALVARPERPNRLARDPRSRCYESKQRVLMTCGDLYAVVVHAENRRARSIQT